MISPSRTLRYYRGSPLTGSPNKCISDFTNASSKFLTPLGTSDMPKTLAEIPHAAFGIFKNMETIMLSKR